jgi:hypothetical protein
MPGQDCVVIRPGATYGGVQGPYTPSADEPCIAVLARTDPNERESVVLLDREGRRHAGA